MSNKLAAALHGTPCSGACCRNPWGVCTHARVCQYHLDADAEQARRDWQADALADLRRVSRGGA